MDLRISIPTFIHVSDRKLNYVKVLDLPLPGPGALYVTDSAFLTFAQYYHLNRSSAVSVTRE